MRRTMLVLSVAAATLVPGSPASAALPDADIELTVVESLTSPIALATRPSDPALYIAEQGGRVQALEGGDVDEILDITAKVQAGGEQGLLGLTFSPTGDKLYAYYTDNTGDNQVSEFPVTEAAPITIGAERKVLHLNHPTFGNHNGGNIAFGPDGYLYIGTGDGGGSDDPRNNAQSKKSLLGKMLRIDPAPDGNKAYTNPPDNPYVGRKGKDEIWAKGLRNPWRWSFDRDTDDLWIGDVGQNQFEEIDFQPASSDGGENYGWRRMEGFHQHIGKEPKNNTLPVYEYDHGGGNQSVTGGYVYRGSAIGDLVGAYVFADYAVGALRAFMPSDPDGTDLFLGPVQAGLVSFGQDNDGELYVMAQNGNLYRIDPDV